MQKLKLLALAVALFAATTANAAQLLSATYIQDIQGVPLVLTSTSATGTLVGNSYSLDAGAWFATSFCVGNPGNPACIPNPSGPFAAPVTRLVVTFTNNGAVSGTTADPTLTVPSGIMGLVRVMAKIGKAPAFTLLPIVVNAGAGGTLTIATPPTSPSLSVQLKGDVWHIGQITQTGLTNAGVALPDAMGTGSVVVTGGGNTVVNLVSLSRIRVRGLATSNTSAPSYLRLVYPEPGTLMLLGAGVAGLAIVGRRKLR